MRQALRPMAAAAALFFVFSCALSAQVVAAAATAGNFSYSGDTGPGFWNRIDARCAPSPTGRQSPIDIDRVVEDARLAPLNLILPPVRFTLTDSGATIVAQPQPGGFLILGGQSYSLLQFHFHALSEHTVAGVHGAMELHAVFQDANGDFAVVGVLYRIGRSNPFLAKLIEAGLPQQTSSAATTVNDLNLGEAFTDTEHYFTYPGSLTTPNCSENVQWFVLKEWAEISAAQAETFRHVLGNDFRPLQARNGRVVRATAGRHHREGGHEDPEPELDQR